MTKEILKKNKAEGRKLPDFKQHYNATGTKTDTQINGTILRK